MPLPSSSALCVGKWRQWNEAAAFVGNGHGIPQETPGLLSSGLGGAAKGAGCGAVGVDGYDEVHEYYGYRMPILSHADTRI